MSGQSRHALPNSYRRFVPQPDVSRCSKCRYTTPIYSITSFWNFDVKRPRGVYIDHELKPGRLLNRQVGELRAFECTQGVDNGRNWFLVCLKRRFVW